MNTPEGNTMENSVPQVTYVRGVSFQIDSKKKAQNLINVCNKIFHLIKNNKRPIVNTYEGYVTEVIVSRRSLETIEFLIANYLSILNELNFYANLCRKQMKKKFKLKNE